MVETVQPLVNEITALTSQLRTDTMALWSDEKRKDFVGKFDERARVSQYIALKTAQEIATLALSQQFISAKHQSSLPKTEAIYQLRDSLSSNKAYLHNDRLVGSRPISELNTIAKQRAEEILANLPALKTAVAIINPDISKAIDERDALLEKGKLMFEQAQELSGELCMADLDQKMTIGDFREYVKERNRKRRDLLMKLDDIGKEAKALNNRINRFLYAGLPGLSQAVIDVINNLAEKSTALGTMNRRVGEKVMFGDSTAAITLLQSFENDEVKVSTDVKAQFDAALDALKLAGAKKHRTLKKGK